MDKKTLEIQIKLLANQALTQVKEFSNDIKNAADKAKGFTGDAKGVATSIKTMQAEAQRTANQLKLFGLTSSDLRNTTQNLKKTILDLTDSGLKPESKEVQNLIQKYKELEEQTNKAEASEQGLFGVIGKLKNEIGSLAAVAAAVKVDQAVGNLAKSSLDVNNSFQKIKDDFGIMLGDVEAGIGLFNELQEFNFWTPFDIEQTSQAAKVLVSAKVPLKDLTDYLIRFGDIAQGDAQRFQSYINAFSKASAKGKADMEVLNVYTDQGVQILDALGQQLGKTSAEIVKMASEGKISFQDLDDALNALASEGGLYYGTLEKAAMRLDAVQAGLDESVKTLKASFGQMLAPAVSAVLSAFTKLIDKINRSPILKGILAAAIATVVTLINVKAVQALITLGIKIWTTYAAQMALNSALAVTNPLLIAGIAAVATLTAGYVAYASFQQKAADESANAAVKNKEQSDSIYQLANALDYLNTKGPITLSLEPLSIQAQLDSVNDEISKTEANLKDLKSQKQARAQNPTVGMTFSIDNYGKEIQYADNLDKKIKEAQTNLDILKQKANELQNKIKELNNFSSEWQQRLSEIKSTPVERLQQEQEQALKKLNEKAAELYGEGYENWEVYLKEKAALNEYYNKKIADENVKAQKVLQDWIDKVDPVGALERQKAEALKKNAEAAKQLYGETYRTQEDYIRANKELEKEYDEKIATEKEKQLKKYGTKWEQMLKNIQKNLDKAIEEKNLSAVAAYSTQGAVLKGTQNTEVGQVAQGFANGGVLGGIVAIIQAFVGAIIKAIEALKNGQKVLNFITTIVSKIFDVIGSLIDDALEPTARLLELIGTVIGKLIKPLAYFAAEFAKNETFIRTISVLLEVICELLDVLFQVLQPIIDIIIKILKIFGYIVNPAGLIADKLYKTAEDIDKINEEIEKQQELLKKKYQRMQDAIQEQLDSQLVALKSQYELGLISREQYEKQAQKYSATADEKIYDLEKEMQKKLEEIEQNTKETAGNCLLSEDQKKKVLESKNTELSTSGIAKKLIDADPTGLTQAVTTGDWGAAATSALTGGLIDTKNNNIGENIANAATGGLYNVGKKIGKFFGWWDVGSYDIPEDQFGMVHKGETIIPKTFAEGIRSGKLALVGNENSRTAGNNINISVNVNGSVVTENQLVEVVYKGISRGIQAKKYAPLLA